MPRLLIGNEFNEDRASLVEAKQKKTAWWTQRLAWFAQDGDVLVFAVAPDEEFLAHVTALTGVRRASLRVVVPPPGELGTGVLTADRLADLGFLAELAAALGGPVDELVCLHPDIAIAALADALRCADALPGYGFLSQAGGRLVNSKPTFRALAAGAGVPLPAGAVCASGAEVVRVAGRLLTRGAPVILKHEFRAGGRGNEILSPVPGLTPVGAERAVTVPDRAALTEYVERRWGWLSSRGQSPVVVERYHPGSRAVFAEFEISDKGPQYAGQGELMSAPLAAAQVVPIPDMDQRTVAELVDGAARLCEPLHLMGYRGMLSADAIVTAAGEVLFTEYNGRITGSTPIYRVIGERVVGPDYATTRTLMDRDGWPVPSFGAALAALDAAGLGYDPATRTGVLLVMPFNPANSSVRYCVVDTDLAAVRERQQAVERLFDGPPR